MASHLSFNGDDSSARKDDGNFGRIGLLTFSSLYTFFFVGAIMGWGPMQRMMEDGGAFAYKCSENDVDEDGTCTAQSQTIVNIGFIATTLSVLTPLIGFAVDHYGAPAVSYGLSCSAIIGSGLLVVAAAIDTSWLYWPSFVLLALTTYGGSLLSVQVGIYFQGHTQVRVIMWLNALFDAGSVSYLFLWMLEESFGASFVTVTSIYFLMAVVLYSGSAYFWTIATPEEVHFIPEETDRVLGESAKEEQEVDPSETTGSVSESLRFFQESKMGNSLLNDIVDSRRGSLRDSATVHGSAAPSHLPAAVIYGSIQEEEGEESSDKEQYVLVADRSVHEQLFSAPYVLLVFFFSVSQISCNWSLITAADFLASLGDDGTYLKLFTLCQPTSVLALPLVDYVIREYGFGASFQCVNLINFVYIFIKCFSTNLHLQVITFVMVAAVRCFLYASVFSFLPSLLSADVVGRGTGFLYMIGGLASFLNLPLNEFAARGDFFTPNLMYLISVIPCTMATRYVQQNNARETKIKEERKTGAAVPVSML